jgi:serine/threonine protein kinase
MRVENDTSDGINSLCATCKFYCLGNCFQELFFLFIQIGQGTYSNVYRARDLEKEKIVALKKVRFDNLEPESVKFMAREILILRRLDHPNVIKLEGLVTSRMSCSLYLVFEYMEHDLAGLASFPGVKFTESQVCSHIVVALSV